MISHGLLERERVFWLERKGDGGQKREGGRGRGLGISFPCPLSGFTAGDFAVFPRGSLLLVLFS